MNMRRGAGFVSVLMSPNPVLAPLAVSARPALPCLHTSLLVPVLSAYCHSISSRLLGGTGNCGVGILLGHSKHCGPRSLPPIRLLLFWGQESKRCQLSWAALCWVSGLKIVHLGVRCRPCLAALLWGRVCLAWGGLAAISNLFFALCIFPLLCFPPPSLCALPVTP